MATKTETKKQGTAAKSAAVTKTAAEPVKAKTETVKQPAAVKKTVEKKVAEKKEAPAKKAVAKKTAAKKEIKVKAVVEYYGKQVEEKDMIAAVKKAWTRSGKRVGDIQSIELYIKPEEDAVYYVVNDTFTGAVAF